MIASIMNSVKRNLGLGDDYTPFDETVLTHINSAFSTLTQLGIGPAEGFMIEDTTETWDAFLGSDPQLNSVKSYVYLRVRLLFDPPATSFHIQSQKEQITEMEWRLNVKREGEL